MVQKYMSNKLVEDHRVINTEIQNKGPEGIFKTGIILYPVVVHEDFVR